MGFLIPELVLFGGLLPSGVQTTKEKAYIIVEKKSRLGNGESILNELLKRVIQVWF